MIEHTREIDIEELSEELNVAGLHAFQDYESMGRSGDAWHAFRKKIAGALLERLKIYKEEE